MARVPSSAGPSRLSSFRRPPPPHTEQDQEIREEARAYLSPKRRFLHLLPSWSRARSKRNDKKWTRHEEEDQQTEYTEQETLYPTLRGSALDGGLVELHDELLKEAGEDAGSDEAVYRWAVIYENQRGITMFSTPYYSPQTLLPLDPPPYTLPTPRPSKTAWSAQPTVSLASYPLPDATWRWISRAWMIDMRGDGLVQHDGFEYAWSFRSGRWRPEIGTLSTGAWVRRRRWVRLMVRVRTQRAQADAERAEREGEAESELEGEMPAVEVAKDVYGATRPPSVVASEESEDEKAELEVWVGDDGDWERCRAALKKIGRDGRKLELWKRWFGFGFHSEKDEEKDEEEGKGKLKAEEYEVSSLDNEIEEDVGVHPIQPPREYIATVVRAHGSDILRTFVFPDSRAQFLEILDAANLLGELKAGMGIADHAQVLDFWSYAPTSPTAGRRDEAGNDPHTDSEA
ncbi:hypothetical protein DAEQUDRAFT_769080 [Daedalea quercina L-15889]|uniref:TECPR1-like DysF domain-containing protein n=1 Tax=Daedalea quercina L-15889 TaxID=1314783 RepID=A0A165M1V3_9APHY|nr:hypothetical protein DAEQUDRAFT_769080 [Daedalea quercina L-15889]